MDIPLNNLQRKRRRLTPFIALATIAHLALIAIPSLPYHFALEPMGDLTLKLVGSEYTISASSVAAKSTRVLSAKKSDIAVMENTSPAGASTINATDTMSYSVSSNTQQTVRSIADNHAIRQHLLGRIQSKLSRYLVYPTMAHQRGWQGEVQLAVDVHPSGDLENIHITRSSGYRVLDYSAQQALIEVKRIAMAVNWQGHTYTNMTVPVKYKLTSKQ